MAIERYKYRAINENGRPIRGVISANNEVDLYNQLQSAGMELIDCSAMGQRPTVSLSQGGKVTIRDLLQFLIGMEQMQDAGVALIDALGDMRDSTDSQRLKDILSEVHRDVLEGSSFSEALARHPKVFNNLYISLIKAGEDTGDLTMSYRQLIKYMKWSDDMRSKIKKASTYPMIVVGVVIVTVVVMMGFVVPQIVTFLDNLDQELPFYTVALIQTADFFKSFWWLLIVLPVGLFAFVKILTKLSDDAAYRIDYVWLNMPVAGPIIRKITIARYAQTFGALFASGIDVISALRSARQTVTNRALIDALESVERYVQTGNSLSESFDACGEFPSMVVRMLKIGEESGNLTKVLDQVAEFYTKDVDEAISGMIAMIEPTLTGILGGMILWIAAGVFGPIYNSFGDIDF